MTDYASSGVNRKEGYRTVSLIKESCERTRKPGDGVLTGIGSFASLYALSGYREPVLVSGTDGVGTKLELAIFLDRLEGVGIDCVAMCVNDIICHGARPLFFLDYLACGKLEAEQMARVVEGVSRGCIASSCALVGGETAEMPGFYRPGDFDIAGFALGAVERDRLIDGSKVEEGDLLIGLSSSGPHSNGFSLIRSTTTGERGSRFSREIDGKSLAELLLEPTRIYVQPLLSLVEKGLVKAAAHITGGGLYENLPRSYPGRFTARIERSRLQVPPLFDFIASFGITEEEMFRTFNMGTGMVLTVDPGDAKIVEKLLEADGFPAAVIGRMVEEASEEGIWIE